MCSSVSDEQLQQFPQGQYGGFPSRAQLTPASRGEPAPDTRKVANAEVLTVDLAGEVCEWAAHVRTSRR